VFLALDKPVRRRIGDYRVLCTIDEGRLVVLVLDAGHRSEIYDR
jgi:mRNA interferase RelE/StbE